jgi:hydroxymethylpyrimidine pyrophosphatase-like HAD family hydrolase
VRYIALAADYDGTTAHHGRVDQSTLRALDRARSSGRKLILVTGRQVDDLIGIFPEVDLFDRVVAENGAVIYDPATRSIRAGGDPPSPEFAAELARRGVSPLSTGHVIVSTWEPHETAVFEVIRDFAVELQVIFNKGAVMVLPTGINKATGLVQALADLGLSLHNTVGIGDAENDQTFLGACECGVAVANALDSVKARVDLVTAGDHGAGVAELVEQLLKDDLLSVDSRLTRHQLLIGRTLAGEAVHVMPFGRCILVAGPSAAGKTTIATSFLEQLAQQRYQYCIVDPEGDYKELPDAASLGGAEVRPLVDAVMEVLTKPDESVAVNLLNHRLTERPTFFSALLPRLQQLRTATGRPHWIIVDEAHHLLPSGWQPASETIPGELANLVLITVHPDHVAPAAIRLVDTLIVVGRDVGSTIAAFDPAHGPTSWKLPDVLDDPSPGEAWLITATSPAVRFTVTTPESDQRRHRRKYAEGELGPDKSFYFRGPDGRLNLRAQNLMLFAQLAEGVDDETWLHHLQRRDYSRWFREAIKDEGSLTKSQRLSSKAIWPQTKAVSVCSQPSIRDTRHHRSSDDVCCPEFHDCGRRER